MKTNPEALKILVAVANQYKYALRDLRLAMEYEKECRKKAYQRMREENGTRYNNPYGKRFLKSDGVSAAQVRINDAIRTWKVCRACYYAAKKAAGRKMRFGA